MFASTRCRPLAKALSRPVPGGRLLSALALSATMLWSTTLFGAPPEGNRGGGADPKPTRGAALLIGCTKYDHNKAFNLLGPGNDVQLLKRRLVEQFGFDPARIIELTESAATALGPHRRPTRENIAREYASLAKNANPGDQVVVLMAGHGSRQPEQDPPDPKYPKPDGKDQIFLPADIGKWNGKERKVENAIVDYELRGWNKAITAKGASLWLIVDSCCSGSTMRGTGDIVMRQVNPGDLAIPADATRGTTRSADLIGSSPIQLDDQSPNFVGLYAAEPDQPEIECPLPDTGPNRKRYGLLTYTVCQVLERSGGDKINYEELLAAVAQSYQKANRSPRPLMEGLARKRAVLGYEELPRSTVRLVEAVDDGWRINGGKLFGLLENSILAVYPPAGEAGTGKPVGFVKVISSDATEATVAPCEYQGTPSVEATALKPGSRCEIARIDYGPLKVPVAVDERPIVAGVQVDWPRLMKAKEDLTKLAGQPDSLFELAKGERPARWMLQERAGKLVLLPADAAEIQDALPAEVVQFVLDEASPAADAGRHLNRIARGSSLLEIAGAGGMMPQGVVRPAEDLAASDTEIDVDVVALKLKDRNDKVGEPLVPVNGQLELKPGDWVGFRITNHSRFKVDVSLLFVDSEYAIAGVFPRKAAGVDNQIPSGGQMLVGVSKISANTVGTEHLVVIAVHAQGQPTDFTVLAESTLKKAGAISRGGASALDSRLGKLMQSTVFGGGTRGLDLDAGDAEQTFRTGLIAWRVALPGKGGANQPPSVSKP